MQIRWVADLITFQSICKQESSDLHFKLENKIHIIYDVCKRRENYQATAATQAWPKEELEKGGED